MRSIIDGCCHDSQVDDVMCVPLGSRIKRKERLLLSTHIHPSIKVFDSRKMNSNQKSYEYDLRVENQSEKEAGRRECFE